MSSIERYPIWGITRFTLPYSRFDHWVIAWGGVAAQAVVAVPLIAWVELFGYSRFQPVNAMLAIGGFLSLSFAVFLIYFPFAVSTDRLLGDCSPPG